MSGQSKKPQTAPKAAGQSRPRAAAPKAAPAVNPRALAVRVLMRQEQDGYANLVLDAELKKQPLPPRDRAFVSAIFYTVLEKQGTIDYILGQYLPKGLAKLDAPVRAILRSGLAQALFMQVPPSAAVNESVALARSFKKASAAGMVNAVLRRACAWESEKAVFADEIERLMVLGSAGRPVAEFLHRYYPDEALDILRRKADAGRTALRVNPLKTTPEKLAEALLTQNARSAVPGFVPGSLLVEFAGSPAENELFRQGAYHVEGQTSQLAALCLGARPGEKIVDLCAAPGGKSIAVAEQMQDNGILYSCDVSENRVSLIRAAVQRMGLRCVRVLCNDAAAPAPEHAALFRGADRILADVPCSGLGILAKKPDIRYKSLDPAEMAALTALQAKILEQAASLLKTGGRLVYSTCTINPAENERQIEAFLNAHPEFSVRMPEGLFPAGMTIGPCGALSVPTRTGMDGFFICVLEKRPQEKEQ